MEWISEHWATFIGPAVVAAAVSGVVSFVGMIVSTRTARALHSEKLEFDRQLAERKFEFDKELAERKFAQDRAELIHKRRFELGETLLADAYRFRDIMRYARTNVSFEIEGESRKTSEIESENLKRMRDQYFVPVERLQKESEFISGFWAKRHSALAHFGSDATKGFDLFNQSMNDMRTASEMLIKTAGWPNNEPDFIHQMQGDLWVGYAAIRKKDDEVGKKIDGGVLLFENICRPVLEWKGA